MRILHVIPSLQRGYGGPSKAVVEMADAAAAAGHEVSIYSTRDESAGERSDDSHRPTAAGVIVREMPVESGGRLAALKRYWRYSPGLAEELSRRIADFDIVHVHSLYLYHLRAAADAADAAGIPYIIRPHGTLHPVIQGRNQWRKRVYTRFLEKGRLSRASAFHYTSAPERQSAELVLSGYGISVPGFVAPLGIDCDEFKAEADQRDGMPIGSGPLSDARLLFLGRKNFKKGLDILCRSFADLLNSYPDCRLMIVGPEDGTVDLKRLIDESGIAAAVEVRGMTTGAEKAALLAGADIFVLPSRNENMGVAAIEALAAGLPVVISREVDIAAEVKEYRAGIVCEVNADDLARALLAALADRAALAEMGRRGREVAVAKFDRHRNSEILFRSYRQLVEFGELREED